MKPTETMQLQRAHVSVRQFTDEAIESTLLHELIACGQAAATSSFVQAYSILRISDPTIRSAIAQAAGNQKWIETAAEFLVYCADLRRIDLACQQHGEQSVTGLTEHSLVAVIDASLMAQNVLLAAESAGLGGVFIGGIRNDPQVIIDQCQLPKLVLPLFGMCLGWPSKKNETKPRMTTPMILHENHYNLGQESAVLKEYDQVMQNYYNARSSNQKNSVWSAQTVQAIQGKKRVHMADIARQQQFFTD